MVAKFIAYYRVSTNKQARSGLGLKAQQNLVKSFCKGKASIIAEYTEVESGRQNSRASLEKALQHCKSSKAVLVVAKLDRLSRDVEFIFRLKNSGVEFVCADMPEANTLTIGIFASWAQHEREQISSRTKQALAAKKAQGFKLGKPENLTNQARSLGGKARGEKARGIAKQNYQTIFNKIVGLRAKGLSYAKIAKNLNSLGIRTVTDKPFFAMQVRRIFELFAGQEK